MTLTLPNELRERLEQGAVAEGVASVEEYVQLLAERDRASDHPLEEMSGASADEARARPVALVRDGLDSGPAEVVGPEFWESLRQTARGGSAPVEGLA